MRGSRRSRTCCADEPATRASDTWGRAVRLVLRRGAVGDLRGSAPSILTMRSSGSALARGDAVAVEPADEGVEPELELEVGSAGGDLPEDVGEMRGPLVSGRYGG